jgi:hypothetical protein
MEMASHHLQGQTVSLPLISPPIPLPAFGAKPIGDAVAPRPWGVCKGLLWGRQLGCDLLAKGSHVALLSEHPFSSRGVGSLHPEMEILDFRRKQHADCDIQWSGHHDRAPLAYVRSLGIWKFSGLVKTGSHRSQPAPEFLTFRPQLESCDITCMPSALPNTLFIVIIIIIM